MIFTVAALPNLASLRRHVLETLCSHDRLDPEQAQLQQSLIVRSGKPCGLAFHLHGTRLCQTYAIWVGQEDRILFYDSSGLRFAETRLSDGPDPLALAA